MPNKHTLSPLFRQALLAMLADPDGALTRIPGGYYCPKGTNHPVFTARTIRAMQRDGLVKLDAELCTSRVDFTNEGRAAAVQLKEALDAQAGAA